MILPDVNLLIYAYNSASPMHTRAAAWWQEQVSSGQSTAVCWPVFQAFLRLLSGRSVVESPYPVEDLFNLCDQWWAHHVTLLGPSKETLKVFRDLSHRYQIVGSSSTDALIAAYALEHRARLATNDTDFLRFDGLKVFNPLT